MQGFKLDQNGDIVMKNNTIEMVEGDELTRQTVQTILGTNKREWFLNGDEGINFNNFLGKTVEDEIIRNEVAGGLSQVDSSFFIENFKAETEKRKLKIEFSAKNDKGTEIGGVKEWR